MTEIKYIETPKTDKIQRTTVEELRTNSYDRGFAAGKSDSLWSGRFQGFASAVLLAGILGLAWALENCVNWDAVWICGC